MVTPNTNATIVLSASLQNYDTDGGLLGKGRYLKGVIDAPAVGHELCAAQPCGFVVPELVLQPLDTINDKGEPHHQESVVRFHEYI